MSQITSAANERVQILYGRAFYNISTAVIATLILVYIYRDQIAIPVLLSWLGYMLFSSFLRYWNVFKYNSKNNISPNPKTFENQYSYLAGITGLGWAFFILTALTLPTFEYRMYSILLTTAIVALAVPVFSTSIKTLYFYITPSLLVSIPFLLYQGGNDATLGIALLAFSAMVLRSGKESYSTLNDTLTLRHETKELAENLKQLQHEKSETQLCMQAIMDHAPASIYVKNLDGQFTFANQKMAGLYHMTHDEIIGKTLYDIYPKDIADIIVNNDNEVIAANKPIEHEESLPRKDGIHHYNSINFPLFDETGNVFGVGGISTDITERHKTEETLRIFQQRLLLHREQSPVGVVEWNTNFEVLDWNPAAESIFGYSKSEMLGKRAIDMIVPENDLTVVDDLFQALLANKGGRHSINKNITKDGRTILCEWHSTPLMDDNGNIIGVSAIVDDITERQQKELKERQTQKMDAIGKLTGGIAHDFNNMLGVILGFSDLIKKGMKRQDTELIKYCSEVINAGERAKNLTSNLLEFSRTAPSSSEATSVNELLKGMRLLLKRTLTPRIKLIYELEEGLWPLWLDKARLEDAILNVCINAMHAMPNGGTLTLNTCTKHFTKSKATNLDLLMGDYVVLSITDTGAGMTKNVQEKIFDPFFTTKGVEGTGLGLSQVHGFVQQAGGVVKVSSKIGQGTKLTLYIPRHLEGETTKPAENMYVAEEKLSGHETILVVDDEAALLVLSEVILTKSGYTALTALNGEQALKILEENSVDLMLCDVIMPDMDGYQLAAKVKKLYPEVNIQMISGYSIESNKTDDANKLHEKRLHKPVTTDALLGRIRNILDQTP